MPHEKMSKFKSVGPISVLLLPSPALLLAEGEAQVETKAPRLRAQQRRPMLAERAKASFEKALRYLRRRAKKARGDSQGLEVCRPSLRGSHLPVALGRAKQSRKSAH